MSRGSPQEFVNIGAQLLQRGEHSKRCAITTVDPLGVIERFTFADVAREAALWASLVRRHELRPGDRVVVLAGPAWEWRCALLGVLYAGGVAVPCPESVSTDELQAIAADAEATLVASIQARPDFVDRDGPRALTAEELETVDQTVATRQPPTSRCSPTARSSSTHGRPAAYEAQFTRTARSLPRPTPASTG
jgi:acyl-CoA synthetase (AMP-forming)/AMP-acid ligase II